MKFNTTNQKGFILVLFGVVVLIFVLAGGVYYFGAKSSKNNQQSVNQPATSTTVPTSTNYPSQLPGNNALDETIKVKLIDAFSGQNISNTDARVYSDNGNRCITTPCNTEGQEWTGKSSNDGIILIPSKVINIVTNITTTGYKSGRDLNRDSEKIDNNNWLIELDPDSKVDNLERRLKLIDFQAQKPLANTTIWVINNQNCNPPQCSNYSFTGTTNSQGNIYYKISLISDSSWIFVNNYKVAKFPTGWVNFKVILEKE